jgi:D-beta-D-heptose 7-phosphate kinase/D-beta-D-heptose 1-phosphate adenosyltransferase
MSTVQPKQFKVLLIGDSCEDIYQYGTIDRLSPEAPVPVFVPTHSETKRGMAGNVAANLEALGVGVISLLGEESKKTRLIDTRSKQHIARIDEDTVSDVIDLKGLELAGLDAVVISDYAKGAVSYELIQSIREQYNGPIFLDTKKQDLAKFNNIYVKINQLEFDRAWSINDKLIVTQGSKGAMYNTKSFDAPGVEVVDVTGAGDTFLSALVYKYLETNSIDTAIEFAIRASSITVQHLGVYSPTLEEIE